MDNPEKIWEQSHSAQHNTSTKKKTKEKYPEVPILSTRVDEEKVVRRLASFLSTYCKFPKDSHAIVIAVWEVHTWLYDIYQHSPVLALTSAMPSSGKSTVLKVLKAFAHKPNYQGRVTLAYLKSHINKYKPTMLLDELDSYLKDPDHEIYNLFNNGFDEWGVVSNMNPTKGDEEGEYEVYCPKAIARNGRIPNRTFETRCITIKMRTQPKATQPPRLILKDPQIKKEMDSILKEVATLSSQLRPRLRGYEKNLPKELYGRYEDSWEPLIEIADNISPDIGAEIRKASVEYMRETEKSLGTHFKITLLEDIRDIFDEEEGMSWIRSVNLVEKLLEIEDHDYHICWKRGKLTPQGLSTFLRDFEIEPEQKKIEGKNLQRYQRSMFEGVWLSHCPKVPTSPTPPTSVGTKGSEGREGRDFPELTEEGLLEKWENKKARRRR